MSLHYVTALNKDGDEVVWYFEEHQYFLRAVKRAKELGIWVTDNDGNPDLISDLDEFLNWTDEHHPKADTVLRSLVKDLTELGFDKNDPINGGDCVDVIALHFDRLKKATEKQYGR